MNKRHQFGTQKTLRDQVNDLISLMEARTNALNQHYRSDHIRWVARGRRVTLQRAVQALRLLPATYLYLGLEELLDCLDKWSIDAQEDQHEVVSQNGWQIEKWKAEGEATEIPWIAQQLSSIIATNAPSQVCHPLALDGQGPYYGDTPFNLLFDELTQLSPILAM